MKSPFFQITYVIILSSIDLGPQLYALHWLLFYFLFTRTVPKLPSLNTSRSYKVKDTDACLSFFHPGMLPSYVLFPFFIFFFPAFSLHAPRFSNILSSRENSSFSREDKGDREGVPHTHLIP